jgi:hypothetical protein
LGGGAEKERERERERFIRNWDILISLNTVRSEKNFINYPRKT